MHILQDVKLSLMQSEKNRKETVSLAIREVQLFKVFDDLGPSIDCTMRQYKVNLHMNGAITACQVIGRWNILRWFLGRSVV